MKREKKILCVEICEAKPNKLFTEEQTSWVRFLRYNRFVACAHCGKKKRVHWTMLCAFRSIHSFDAPEMTRRFSLDPKRDGKPFPPLTPVCDDHCLAPDFQ